VVYERVAFRRLCVVGRRPLAHSHHGVGSTYERTASSLTGGEWALCSLMRWSRFSCVQ
jgi:hypothetical protein